ncbi:MAG: phosphoethanolamine--lipid A transferase [Acidobacteria bacterium]|nr:phosphoethanolamine--lipid A transferase [Acidobacteriota bacterium]
MLRSAVRPRRTLSLPAVIAIASLWFVVACNAPFWRDAIAARGGVSLANLSFFASLFLFTLILTNLLLTLLAPRPIAKAMLGFFFAVTPILTYFMATHGVLIDGTMIRNTFETDPGEAGELITPRMLGYLALLGLPPLAWLTWIRLETRTFRAGLASLGLMFAGTFAGVGAIAALHYQDYASFLRNHRELRYRLAPLNFVSSIFMYSKESLRTPRELRAIGTDAHQHLAPAGSRRNRLVVIVVGETARAANFSLGGYARQTNPELASRNVVYFSDVEACSTSTANSLPCMFSSLGSAHFDQSTARSQENLLDVLEHAGVSVLWRENNSGCKGICDRVETEVLSHLRQPGVCSDEECFDEILLGDLQQRIDRMQSDMVIVLHQKGSHGPGYHLRYPARFKVFTPTCETNSLEQCSAVEIANAYDNTIRYTDHILAQTIDLLERNAASRDTAMLYVSDHGESLGEKGVYLHGIPPFFAPDTQTHVPMIVWLSEGFARNGIVDRARLDRSRGARLSHDNLFHSVLGLLDIDTSVYQSQLDVFRAARPVAATIHASARPHEGRS